MNIYFIVHFFVQTLFLISYYKLLIGKKKHEENIFYEFSFLKEKEKI